MSAQMLLATIKTLEVNNLNDDALSGFARGLETILDCSQFGEDINKEAFIKLTEIREVMGKRAGQAQAKCDAMWKKEVARVKMKEKLKRTLKKPKDSDEIPPGSTEEDMLNRLKIRSEEDGTLSFEFRGILWNWNHTSNEWDYSPKK